MKRAYFAVLSSALLVLIVSYSQAIYFAGYRPGRSTGIFDSLSLYAPFEPVAIMYAKNMSPYWGVPLNVAMFVLLWMTAAFLRKRPIWQRSVFFAAEWLLATLASTWFLLKSAWGV
jgi:hypothetical protein